MSYLNSLRFHFAGRFRSDVSTVNNHPGHYNNDTFNRSQHWRRGSGGSFDHGWWNPEGTHRFRFHNVQVEQAFMGDGTPVGRDDDSVYQFTLQSRGRIAAKMADLDPDQQGVSMIYGLKQALMRDNIRVMECELEPVPFADMWRRVPNSGLGSFSVFYQSVLRINEWGDLTGSPFLQALRDETTEERLSIKFILDGYNANFQSPEFTFGRVVGTIGPVYQSEPRHWVIGRHLAAGEPLHHSVAVLDESRQKVRIDLGNALPTASSGGPVRNLGTLKLGCHKADDSIQEIDEIVYGGQDWYEKTAGIVELPANRALTSEELQSLKENPLCVFQAAGTGSQQIISEENEVYTRADMFVARLDPGKIFSARFHASQLGEPLSGATLLLQMNVPTGLSDFPTAGLSFPTSVTCDADGNAQVIFTAADPGNPRYFLRGQPRVHVDGQVYLIAYALQVDGQVVLSTNGSNILSFLVWNEFTPDEPITWHGSIKEILTQYGNLYPWMTNNGPELDLADYDAVADARFDIIDVLKLPENDQGYMPVTRDMSASRKQAILDWLQNVGSNGKPLLGTPPDSPDEDQFPEDLGGKVLPPINLLRQNSTFEETK